MQDLFERPDPEHSPAAYWFWHRLPTTEEIHAQIAQMEEGGIRSFQIQARLAYPIEQYLDMDFLAKCREAVVAAATRSMEVGIYDEYNWQSGQAGGRTVHGADHLRERHIFWSRVEAGAGERASISITGITSSAASLGEAGMVWQYDDARMSWADWEVVAAVAYPIDGATSRQEVIELTDSARIGHSDEAECTIEVDLPDGIGPVSVIAFVGARCATSRVPNYLLRDTAERFLEVGYSPFFKSFGEYFGTTVKYFFFDQPHATFYDWDQREGNLQCSIPYSGALGSHIESTTGFRFAEALLSLVDGFGPDTVSARLNFYQSYSRLVIENYFGPLSHWAGEHNIELSGHEVLGHVGSWHLNKAFSSWDLRVNFGLDYFGVDSYRGITGVDAQDCVPQLSTKLGDSVARSNGRSGCIVEQYIAKGKSEGDGEWAGLWGLSLEELRGQALRLEIQGARQFLYHGFYQTDGYDNDVTRFTNPRFDFPPGINFEPWWPYHRAFADEAARLSVFLDEASPVCEVALLYPLRTAWLEGSTHSYGDHVEFWASWLASEGFGYHLIDERDLRRATFQEGELCLDSRRYRCLVLPSVSSLEDVTSIEQLGDLVDAGVMLIASGDSPVHLQHGAPGDAQRAWDERVASAATIFTSLPTPSAAKAVLGSVLAERPYVSSYSGASLWQWVGQVDSEWRIVLFNDTIETQSVTIELSMDDMVLQHWDATDGSVGPWHSASSSNATSLTLRLEAMELCCLRARAHVASEIVAPGGYPRSRSRESSESSETSLVNFVDGWRLELPDGSGVRVPISVSQGWEKQGFPAVSGVGRYVNSFEVGPESADLLLDLPVVNCAVEVFVNSTSVGRRGWSPYRFLVSSQLLHGGKNEIELVVSSAAGNHYYANTPYQDVPESSGLAANPLLSVAPSCH
jgi:hypothetical protein